MVGGKWVEFEFLGGCNSVRYCGLGLGTIWWDFASSDGMGYATSEW